MALGSKTTEAALSFDLLEALPFGYDTEIVGPGTVDNFDEISSLNGGSSTLAQDVLGDLQFTYAGTQAFPGPVPPASSSQRVADIVINNIGTGTAHINELYLNYVYETTPNGAILSTELLWSPFTGASATDASFVQVGNLGTGKNTSGFQGETVWVQNQNYSPPLVLVGDSGTLRLRFTGVGATTSTATATVKGMSLTAVIPEPSSALLLTGVLGLFSGFFRKRRVLSCKG